MRRLSSLLAFVGMAALLIAACSTTEQITSPETFADAKALAAEAEKPILINFFATW
jgi:hypothetical protein